MLPQRPTLKLGLTIAAFLLCCELAACSGGDNGNSASHSFVDTGDQQRAHGDDLGAAESYQRAIQADRQNTQARLELGSILEAHGDNTYAEDEYRKGLDTQPDNPDLLHARGRVLIKMNRVGEAKSVYEHALQNDGGDIKAMNGIGIALDYQGQHQAAQEQYKQALNRDPDDLNTVNNLAHSYTLVGDYDSAIKLLEPHVKDKNATPALRQNLAEAYAYAGMDADAERMARMDLPPAQVKKNLDYYKSQRVKLALVPKFYADLGSFPTQQMADVRADEIKARYANDTAGRIVKAAPSVSAIGKTPTFSLSVYGFDRLDKVRAFCDQLKKDRLNCRAQTHL